MVRAERASLSRQAGDEMGRANDQRFVSGVWWLGKLFSDAGGTGFTQARPRFLFDSGSDRACACSPPCTRVAKARY